MVRPCTVSVAGKCRYYGRATTVGLLLVQGACSGRPLLIPSLTAQLPLTLTVTSTPWQVSSVRWTTVTPSGTNLDQTAPIGGGGGCGGDGGGFGGGLGGLGGGNGGRGDGGNGGGDHLTAHHSIIKASKEVCNIQGQALTTAIEIRLPQSDRVPIQDQGQLPPGPGDNKLTV